MAELVVLSVVVCVYDDGGCGCSNKWLFSVWGSCMVVEVFHELLIR